MEYKYSHRKALQQSDEIANFQRRINFIREKFGGKWKYLTPDGIYGRSTRDAVKQFQEFAKQYQGFDNVSVNGKLDDVSQSAVNKFYQYALQYNLPPRRPGQQPNTYFKPLYQTPYAAYSGVPTNGPPPKISHNQPVVDTSSIIDSEWKSLGKDILDITEEVAKYISSKLSDEVKKIIWQEFQKRESALQEMIKLKESLYNNSIKRRSNTFNALHRDKSMVGAVIAKTDDGMDVLYKGTKSPLYKTYSECMAANKNNIEKARYMFIRKTMAGVKEVDNKIDQLEGIVKTADEQIIKSRAQYKASERLTKVGKAAKIASWGINIGTSLYYTVMMTTSDSKEEFNEYADKLGNSLGTTAVDVGLSFGSSLAVRYAGGAAGGPAGIVVVTLFTVLDVVSLCATGESISSHIWNFLKSLNWSEGFKGYNAVKRDNKGIMWL